VGLGIARFRDKKLVEAGDRLIDAPLLQKGVCLSRVRQKEANTREQQNRKDEANTSRWCRNKHD
jgi:hypothetical protein